MSDLHPHHLDALIGKLRRLGPLEQADIVGIRALPLRIESGKAGKYLVREGDRIVDCCVLLSGYACRSKLTSEGRRQIVSFHIPGDVLDLQHLLLARADHNVQLITDARFAYVSAESLRAVAQSHPNVGAALWRDTLIDASIFREWVLNVGQRDARARVAHMLCEFAFRRAAAGLGGTERFELPMTQEQIADATGMTPIHVNRMLAALGAEGIISRNKRQVEIIDWPMMERVADFDPAYLHIAA
jgi:CRP-like cAMP-binding protein